MTMGAGENLPFKITRSSKPNETLWSASALSMALEVAQKLAEEYPGEDIEIRSGVNVVEKVKFVGKPKPKGTKKRTKK